MKREPIGGDVRPPRVARSILKRLLTGEEGAVVLQELDDEYSARVRSMGSASLWYWRQVLAVDTFRLGWLLRRRARRRSSESSAAPTMTFHDLRLGLRAFIRQPTTTFLVVLILALGIGFVTLVASLAHSVFLAAVPYDDPDRIVILWRKGPEPFHQREALSYPNIRDLAERGAPFFEGLSAYTIFASTIVETDGARRVMVTYAEPYFFEALDVDMALGRRLAESDNLPPTGDAVIVLSFGVWQSVFGGAADIVGQSVSLGGHPHTVIGVMARETRWLLHEPLDVVVPFRRGVAGLSPRLVEDRSFHASIVVGRLKPDATVEQAGAGIRAASLALQKEHPDTNASTEVTLTSFADLRSDFGRLSDVVTVIGVASGLVFLLSCISAVLLLLARFVDRLREFAVRMALGAARRSFVYQSFAEGVSVTLLAGAVGFALAYAGVRLVFADNPLNVYSFAELAVDSQVALATLFLALSTTLLFGLVPLMRSARVDFHAVLRPSGGSPGRSLVRRGLVVVQVALSVAILAASALMLRSLHAFTHTDYGFETNDLVYTRLMLDGPSYEDEQSRRNFYRDVQERLSSLPGVTHAGALGSGPSWL